MTGDTSENDRYFPQAWRCFRHQVRVLAAEAEVVSARGLETHKLQVAPNPQNPSKDSSNAGLVLAMRAGMPQKGW